MAKPHSTDGWVRFNHLTWMYETKDGTEIPAETVDSVQCLADVLRIADIREKQRITLKETNNG